MIILRNLHDFETFGNSLRAYAPRASVIKTDCNLRMINYSFRRNSSYNWAYVCYRETTNASENLFFPALDVFRNEFEFSYIFFGYLEINFSLEWNFLITYSNFSKNETLERKINEMKDKWKNYDYTYKWILFE
jgi:hypothetical protein